MHDKYKNYIRKTLELQEANKILLTISGGADSVVMLDLFSKTDYECGIAHCNFHLRGDESNKDEQLVKKLAKKYKYKFFQIDFFTKNYARNRGISIEMAARELRYNWFEEIRRDNGYDYIATAHHNDDVVETFFINLARGTGIRGLSGIKPVSGKTIRPILFADRNSILNYIKENKLEYREDASNNDVKIKRNKLRHDIIPQLAEINTAYKQNTLKTIERLNITGQILEEKLIEIKADVVKEKDNQLFFNISKLRQLNPLNFYLFELLYPYGFNSNQVDSIVHSIDGISGKCFFSGTHQLIKDREYLILIENIEIDEFSIKISNKNQQVKLLGNASLKIKSVNRTKSFKIPAQANIAALDKDKLNFPLEIKNWQKGDYFYPIGMNQKRKLSDFFIDNKFTKFEKEKTLLLLSNEEIVWVIGYRLDNRYKITDYTKNILLLTLQK